MHIKKTKILKEKRGIGPQTSLNIKSSEAKLLWPVGPNNKRYDFLTDKLQIEIENV